MAQKIARLSDLLGFQAPAYTYVLRCPFPDWKNKELTLNYCMVGSPERDWIADDFLEGMPHNDTHRDLMDWLTRYGPNMSYLNILAQAAHESCWKYFQDKQGKQRPSCSIYVQVELGQELLHLHIVMAGQGLNKYNAKAAKNLIAYKWLCILQDHIKLNLGPHEHAVEYGTVTTSIYREINLCVNNCSNLCDILTYRARNGDKYACRVDGREYICNYLLCKNLKYKSSMDPQAVTPVNALFLTSPKTYALSLLNGRYIHPWVRRQWFEDITKGAARNQVEPVFTGEPYGDLPKVEQASWERTTQPAGRMTKREGLMLDCMKRCFDNHYTTYEDLVEACPDLVIMIESQPGGSRLIEQILGMVHIKLCQQYSALTYVQKRYPVSTDISPDNKIFRLLNLQGYNSWQVGHWVCCVLNKAAGKQNTISFFGPASTGKTNLAKALVNTVKLYGCVNHLNKNFVFNDCAAKLVLWWEECLMHTDWVEQAKCLMGGTSIRIDRKHKDSQLLPQTPMIISTNNNIYEVVGGNTISCVHAKPIKDRVVQFNFMKCLPSTFGEISTEETAAWLTLCASRFTPTLQSFYETWNLSAVPNSFPLGELCASHSQDFELHENGICLQCGSYLPLSTECDYRAPVSPVSPSTSTGRKSVSLFTFSPTKDEYIRSFNLCLLETPTRGRKRSVDLSDAESSPLPSTSASSASTPVKKKKKLSFEDQVERLNIFSSQPQNEFQWKLHQAYVSEIEQGQKEPESKPKSSPCTPSQWGEMLGVQSRGPEEEPIVLHCFETMEDSDAE